MKKPPVQKKKKQNLRDRHKPKHLSSVQIEKDLTFLRYLHASEGKHEKKTE
jgi:hypothetical protein